MQGLAGLLHLGTITSKLCYAIYFGLLTPRTYENILDAQDR